MRIYNFQNDYSSQEMPMDLSLEEAPSIDIQSIDVDSIGDIVVEDEIDFSEEKEEPVYQARHVVGNNKFRSSEIISPVYGIVKEKPIEKEDVEEIILEEDF